MFLFYLKELRELSQKLEPQERFVCLLHDEMSIKADLVYDKRSGDLIGFTNPDSWTFNEEASTRN